ncbi:MAG: hypothetical protein ACI841_004107 [Planctomycetota bacterium]|jgi:hypothetical protein
MMIGPGLVQESRTSFGAAGCISAASTWHFQAWYRDPQGPYGSGFNLSNAVSVAFAP